MLGVFKKTYQIYFSLQLNVQEEFKQSTANINLND